MDSFHIEDEIFDSSDDNDEYEDEMDGLYEIPQEFTKLEEMIQKDSSNETIRAAFVASMTEVLLAILKFGLVYSLPNCAVADLCMMFNSFLEITVIPRTRYKIHNLFYPGDNIQDHAVCPECKSYIGEFDRDKRTSQYMNKKCKNNVNLKYPS